MTGVIIGVSIASINFFLSILINNLGIKSSGKWNLVYILGGIVLRLISVFLAALYMSFYFPKNELVYMLISLVVSYTVFLAIGSYRHLVRR